MPTTSSIDWRETIRTVYASSEFPTETADQILQNSELNAKFWLAVNRTATPYSISAEDGNPILLNLRRKGADKGGLIRKHQNPNRPR